MEDVEGGDGNLLKKWKVAERSYGIIDTSAYLQFPEKILEQILKQFVSI